MKRKLKEELVQMSKDIVASNELNDIGDLYEKARGLYEKLAVLKFIEEKLADVQIDVSKNVIAAKFEEMANAVLTGNTAVPENNPHAEDIITPGIDTIKDMVSEMPNTTDVADVFSEFMQPADLMKNEKEILEGDTTVKESVPKSLNDKLSKEIKVGLNDRLGFVKHLFNGSTEDYNRVLSQLNTIDTEERSLAFIENMVKPDYNQWEGKEDYATRFLDLISRKFA